MAVRAVLIDEGQVACIKRVAGRADAKRIEADIALRVGARRGLEALADDLGRMDVFLAHDVTL